MFLGDDLVKLFCLPIVTSQCLQVIKWVRFLQGEALKRIRGAVYKKKFDQRELIKVGQSL